MDAARDPPGSSPAARWRGYGRAALTLGLLLLGAVLLVRHLRSVDWVAMRAVMAQLPQESLLVAGLLAAASYATYCSFDLLGRRATGHPLDRMRVLSIGFVGHACALNLGPAGAGVRLRLYTRQGMPAHLSAALWLFNVATNWLGFILLAGVALTTRLFALPTRWGLAHTPLQGVGIALLALVALYLLACHAWHDRSTVVRGVEFRLPQLSVAALQCGLSLLNWLLLSGIVYVLLRERAPFGDVLGAIMTSALALAVIDVPAGLGILETVFLTLLGSRIPTHELLGGLMAYRAIYFVGPLLLASAVYLALEWDAHNRKEGNRSGAGHRATGTSDALTGRPQSRDEHSPQLATGAPRPRSHRPSG